MATRGVFGIIQNSEFKGFFKTGAFLPYFLKDVKEMVEEIPEDFSLDSIPLIDAGHGERGTKSYELGCLIDLDTDKYLLGSDNSSRNWLSTVSIAPSDSGINPLNTCDYSVPDAGFRPLDSLFIELVVVVNLDTNSIDIYKGGVFGFYPELKHCSSGEDFVKLSESFGQRDNIFVDMYAKHYVDFKKCHDKLKSMSSYDKRQQDFSSRDTHEFLTSARMFDYGPVAQIASISLSSLKTHPLDYHKIIKSYVCFKTLGKAIEAYYANKVDSDYINNRENNKLLCSLEDILKHESFLRMYI